MEIPIILFVCHIVHPNKKFNDTNQHDVQRINTFSSAMIADRWKMNNNE